jgi:hypothetical protein
MTADGQVPSSRVARRTTVFPSCKFELGASSVWGADAGLEMLPLNRYEVVTLYELKPVDVIEIENAAEGEGSAWEEHAS